MNSLDRGFLTSDRKTSPVVPVSWRDPVLWGLIGIGALFLLANLGNRTLWTDEAEAACLARSVLRYGVPQAFDGVNYISQWVIAGREDFNEDLIWVLSPWLQIYVAAASLGIFGIGSFAARLPFALIGIANIWMVYRLGASVFHDRRVARLSSFLLVFCIPFLLHMRQCRYYSLAIFFTIAIFLSYRSILARPRQRKSHVGLILFASLLFHSNYGLCIPLLAALGAHALLYGRRRISPRWAVVDVLSIAALTVPYALYANILRTGSRLDTQFYSFNILNYLICINNYLLPLVLPIVFFVLTGLFRWSRGQLTRSNPGLTAILMVSLADLLFVSSNIGYYFRYIIILVPLLVVLHAGLLVWLIDSLRERVSPLAGRIGVLLIPMAVLTTLLSQPVFPVLFALEKNADRHPTPDNPALRRPRAEFFSVSSEIYDFLHEITHDFDGPNEGIQEFLDKHADREDLVFTEYGDLPLLFETDLAIRGGHQGVPYMGEPDFIVIRAFCSPRALSRFARSKGYSRHVLDVVDIHRENRPDPLNHKFRTQPFQLDGEANPHYSPVVIFAHPRKQLGQPNDSKRETTPTTMLPTPPIRRYRREEGPTNLLLVTIDSLRSDRVFQWDEHFKEPTYLSRFSLRSLSFSRCRSASSGTAPSIASLLTGRYPRDLGFPSQTTSAFAEVTTIASLLKLKGYATAACVSNFTIRPEIGFLNGFDSYFGPAPNEARRHDFATVRQGRHWLLARDPQEPWFLWVHLNGAHGPYRASINPFYGLYSSLIKLKPNPDPPETPIEIASDNSGNGTIPAYQRVPGARTLEQYTRLYDLRFLVGDFFFAELLRTLKVMRVDHRVVVAVTGSHGESLGEHGLFMTHGEDLSIAALETPLILQIPQGPTGRSDQPVSGIDLFPTLAEALGVDENLADTRGLNLATADLTARPGTFSEIYPPLTAHPLAAVIGQRWRIEGSSVDSLRLVNLESNRQVTRPGAQDPEVLAIETLLRDILASDSPEGSPLQLDATTINALIRLGYVPENLH